MLLFVPKEGKNGEKLRVHTLSVDNGGLLHTRLKIYHQIYPKNSKKYITTSLLQLDWLTFCHPRRSMYAVASITQKNPLYHKSDFVHRSASTLSSI